jgi:hypothetical protein
MPKDKKTLGQEINFPGSEPMPTPSPEGSMWDRIRAALSGPTDHSQAAPSPSPVDTPNLDVDTARKIQKGFYGK